jgi:uridine kinase
MLELKAGDTLDALARIVETRRAGYTLPFIVAIDGRSGAGKSTLAARLADALGGAVLDGDAFFAGGVDVRSDRPEQRAADCISWPEQRKVLEALRSGRPASFTGFDWVAFDGSLEEQETLVLPRSVVIVEGVYSARPELADLIDLRVLLRVPDDLRKGRLLAREGTITDWERQWHEAEDWYFAHAAPPEWFDVVVDGEQIAG